MEDISDYLKNVIACYRITHGKEPDTLTLTSKEMDLLRKRTGLEYPIEKSVNQFMGILIRVKD